MTSDTENRRWPQHRCLKAMFLAATAFIATVACGSASVQNPQARPPSPIDLTVLGTPLAIDVTRVSDGDSLRAESIEGDLEIRLVGINAPERDECFGDGARTTLERLLQDAGQVSIAPWPPETDQYGRVLAHVLVGDSNINLELIAAGASLARPQSDHPFAEAFEQAEVFAAERQAGLWGECGSDVAGAVVISDLVADAPGNDRQNPNGEWIELTNVSESEIDLTGWVVRDESTRHRYEFGPVTLSPDHRLRLFSGCGDDDTQSDVMEIYWCDPEPPIWNNDGDTGFVLDDVGTTVDQRRTN